MKFIFLFLFSIKIAFNIYAYNFNSGYIFIDKNRNGIKDNNEKGLKGIPVSNGDTIVLSDKNGYFSIPCDISESVFPILPSEYELTGGSIKNALFYFNNSSNNSISFPVRKTNKNLNFKLAAIGDPQVDNFQQLDYASRSIYQELSNRDDIDINIFIGDIVNEKNYLFPLSKSVIEKNNTPSYIVCGNHDLDYSITQNKDSVFNSYFGASTYSFNKGNVHFIVINNVYSTPGERNYKGYYTDKQLRFIENDLKYVPKENKVVISQHIPSEGTKNFDKLINLLEGRNEIILLSAHTHSVKRRVSNYNNITLHEIIVGTSCGTFWMGEQAWNNIPVSLMNCGTPPCYFIIDFDKEKYSISYKAIGIDKKLQMDIFVNSKSNYEEEISKKSRKAKKEILNIEEIENIPYGAIVANIFGAYDSTEVYISIDNSEYKKMQYYPSISPRVAYLRQAYKNDILPSSHSTKLPLMKYKSPHIWIYSPEGELSKGMHTIKIKAYDNFGYNTEHKQCFIK